MTFSFTDFYTNFVLNKVVSALIIFFLGFIFGKVAGSISKKVFEEIELNKRLKNFWIVRFNPEKLFSKTVSIVIYIITVFMTLNKLGITGVVLKTILIFFALIIVSAFVLDVRDFLPNIISWIKIKKNHYYKVNDKIKIHLAEGVVTRITPFTTKITTKTGDELYIKNMAILENLIVEKNNKV